MLRRGLMVALAGAALIAQIGCVPVAAGLTGAAVGHAAAKRHDKDHDGD